MRYPPTDMNSFTVITAVILGLFALLLSLGLIKAIVSPLLPLFGLKGAGFTLVQPGFFERWAFRRKHKLLKEIDALIDSSSLEKAQELSREAFFLRIVERSPELVSRVGSHHLSLLNKLIMIAELRQQKLENLAVLEGLLDTRTQLMKVLCERRARESGGKREPGWARKEKRAKVQELYDRLQTNEQSIEKQIDELYLHLSNEGDSSAEVQYH